MLEDNQLTEAQSLAVEVSGMSVPNNAVGTDTMTKLCSRWDYNYSGR